MESTRLAWEEFMVGKNLDPAQLAPVVAASWHRARAAAIDPSLARAPLVLSTDALAAERESLEWLAIAEQVLQPHLASIIEAGHVLTLFSADGLMLSSAGAGATLDRLRDIQFMPGTSWSEARVGTNGPGTALATGEAVHIVGSEHFCEAWHPWHCAAIPLRDPSTHAIVGALDISGATASASPYALGMAVALAQLVERALAEHELRRRLTLADARPSRVSLSSRAPTTRYRLTNLAGRHLESARRLATAASSNRLTVLISGESGVGKEVVAQSIHAASARAAAPFLAVNCGAIPKDLIASELFGYVGGAFTGARKDGARGKFEAAHGGTLFLDEIGDLPLAAQASLLRVLQEEQVTRVGSNDARPVDVRVIAATNRDLAAELEAGRFRRDLFYRLNIIHIALPPLRDRGPDILTLAHEFLASAAHETGRRVSLSPEVEAAFLTYAWPGNVRELKNLIRRLSATSLALEVTLADLPDELCTRAAPSSVAPAPDVSPEPQKAKLMAVIQRAKNMAEAASLLGINRSTLYRQLERFGLRPRRTVE